MSARSALPLFAAAFLSAGGASAQPAATAPSSTHERIAPESRSRMAAQNRTLNQVGNKLLRETPRAKPGTTPATGGGLVPPSH